MLMILIFLIVQVLSTEEPAYQDSNLSSFQGGKTNVEQLMPVYG